jgi:hypothetical protein
MNKKILILLVMVFFELAPVAGNTIHVSKKGLDSNNGSQE